MQAVVLRVDASGRIIDQQGEDFGPLVGQRLPDLLGDRPLHEAVLAADAPHPVTVALSFDDGLHLHILDDGPRRRELQQIIQSERQLKEAQEIAGIGSWSWDIQEDRIVWSDQLYRIYGLEPQEFPATYEAYMERIHPDDRELTQQVVGAALETLEPYSFDHRIVRPDGEIRWVHGQGAVVTEGDRAVRMYGVGQDITDMRAAQRAKEEAAAQAAEVARLQAVAAAREQAFQVLAHELRNPLTPMYMHLQMLMDGKLGELNDEAEAAVSIIRKNVGRLNNLTSDMLDVARLSQGRLRVRPAPMDLVDVIHEAVAALRPQAVTEGKEMHVDVPGSLPLQADARRMHQVILNLLSNGLKFTTAGGRIDIHAELDRGHAVVLVQDDGLGLRPGQIDGLFEPFARMHPELDIPGTGLGLHVCQGIIREHGGTIQCDSPGPGKGCRFTLRIPVGPDAAAPMK